jgi:hypothetical protein
MKLLTKALREKLIKNNNVNLAAILKDGNTTDFKPVVKLFNPVGAATWLISELDPETNNMFGLCYLGYGSPELGYVSLDELTEVELPFNLGIERDITWEADRTLSVYADEARQRGTINV